MMFLQAFTTKQGESSTGVPVSLEKTEVQFRIMITGQVQRTRCTCRFIELSSSDPVEAVMYLQTSVADVVDHNNLDESREVFKP